jgi:putative ABC transport system permease protein
MRLPLTYHLRGAFVRKGATLLTLTAIGFSVAVLVLVLALARGFELALSGTGRDDNVVLLRGGSTTEGVSGLGRPAARILIDDACFARDQDGRTLAQPESYAAFNLVRAGGGRSNVPVRGTGPQGLAIRDSARIAPGGRMFVPGRYEIVVGKAMRARLPDCEIGETLEIAGYRWRIVGFLDSGGQAYDSEIWCDSEILLRVLDRSGFNSLFARLRDPGALAKLRARLEADPRFDLRAHSEREYFARQSGNLSLALKIMAWFLATIMGIGAVFGATNTMLSNVAMRTREIGTLLAIGFSPRAVFLGFVFESAVLGLLGGGLGILLGWQCNGIATGTTNWDTFTEQTFAFRVTGDVVRDALLLALLIGVLGGAIPARRAARMVPREALRAV